MSELPLPIRSGSASESVEDPSRESGRQLVMLLSAVIRIGRAYSVTNQVFRTQLDNITTVLRPVLDRSGEAILVALDTDLYLNGALIPVTTSSFRFHQTVIEAFRSRGISGIRTERGIAVDDLAKFFTLFLKPTCPHGGELLRACTDANLQRILPAIHASTDPTREGHPPGAGGESADGHAAHSGSVDAAQGDRPAISGETGGPRGTARKHCAQALEGARSLLTTAALNGSLEMRHAKRVVQPLVDGAFSSEPIVAGLAGLGEHDERTYAHAVSVCAVAVTMGHFLGMDRRTLADLGVAALLHDVGKSVVAELILHPLEAFTEEERAAAERHPLEGAKLLARTTALNSTTLLCIRIALEHHAQTEGEGGYPAFPSVWMTSLLSQTVAVADCYVNLHTRLGDLVENVTPYEALGMMLGPLSTRFEPALLWALVQSVGFYPPGQLIELDDGSIALVLAPNPHDPARPHARVVVDPDGRPLGAKEATELKPVPPEMSVRRALRGGEYPTEVPARLAA